MQKNSLCAEIDQGLRTLTVKLLIDSAMGCDLLYVCLQPTGSPYMRGISGVNLAVFGGAEILSTVSLNGDLKQIDAFKNQIFVEILSEHSLF